MILEDIAYGDIRKRWWYTHHTSLDKEKKVWEVRDVFISAHQYLKSKKFWTKMTQRTEKQAKTKSVILRK